MSKARLEWKVGLFVIISLVFIGLLIMKFSKGAGLFTPTYQLNLRSEDVGGIIPGAAVLMSGVRIGSVQETDLEEGGRNVLIRVEILKKYRIHGDSLFAIKQAGFLGDRFVSVFPGENKAPVLEDGATVDCEPPFDLSEVAKSTAGLMKRVEATVSQLNGAVERIDKTLLTEHTLTNLTAAFVNFRVLSDRALLAVDNVNSFVETNTPPLGNAISNFNNFSAQLNEVADELHLTLETNRVELTATVKNLQEATRRVNGLLEDIKEKPGLAGTLIYNERLARSMELMVSNFSVFSSNLNNKGLWGVIRKPKKND